MGNSSSSNSDLCRKAPDLEVPQQTNGDDCGVHMITFADKFGLGAQSIDALVCDMEASRVHLLLNLMRGRIS
jgi:Ulp1 family protease